MANNEQHHQQQQQQQHLLLQHHRQQRCIEEGRRVEGNVDEDEDEEERLLLRGKDRCECRHWSALKGSRLDSTKVHVKWPRLNAFLASLFLFLFSFLFCSAGHEALAEGNVGCHFVRTLCLEGSEVCFDDNVFGKCIPTTGVDVEDIEKAPLTDEQSRLLATMLEELQGAGLGWDHPYVQCRIQGALFSLQKQTQLPPNLCANLAPSPTDIDPAGAMAFVRFTPPDEDYADALFYPPPKKQNGLRGSAGVVRRDRNRDRDHGRVRDSDRDRSGGDGINAIFHQLQLQDRQLRHDPMELAHFGKQNGPLRAAQVDGPHVMDAFLENERARIQQEQMLREAEAVEAARRQAAKNRLELYQMLAASEPDPQPFQRHPQTPMEKLEQVVEQEAAAESPEYVNDDQHDSNEFYFPEIYAPLKRTAGRKSTPNKPAARSFFRELAMEEGLEQEKPPRDFYSHSQLHRPQAGAQAPVAAYKRMPATMPPKDSYERDQEQQMAFEESLLRNSLTPFEEEAMLASNSYPHKHKSPRAEHVFTEGGLIVVPERQQLDSRGDVEAKKEKAREILANMLGFTRHERLDVKKPGPLVGPPPTGPSASPADGDLQGPNKTAARQTADTKEILPAHIKGSKQADKRKKVVQAHSDEDHAPHSVDTEYAHVFVKNPIDSWSDGVRIMNELANVLHMQGYFTYLTVQPHEVSFRVDSSNPERKTASDIARTINESRGVRNNILRRLGVTVLRAGVGDKIKRDDDGNGNGSGYGYGDNDSDDGRVDVGADGGVSSSRIELSDQSPDATHIMIYMLAGAGAAAVIVIFVTLILIKRHDRKRDKLGGLQSGLTGAESCSKDYQDLCRARMAGKGNAAEPVAGGRITSLSKESDRPPSSRSSTSSWSEEPAMTNMDISTGHMVLSYMEDHLRNKGRLQREWDALCRYEAEPNARDAALEPQCASLNRIGAPLPYDHSRVVLNHLANAEGIDYINASTITDHDPRAPAYVAAQGPLPTTLAHFWQMIWEQGAVVIVSLCRLQENEEIACARYWPEEGAEVYHIYEVHLVSEHIWCDDYLVRSFYLKNLRTSETRTVTQFHFLSWPQGGVPAQAKALLDFRRKVNKSYRGRSCPIVVHGSCGAGRTGAYILLDLVLGRMNKGAREIDIAATLEHLRDQRAGLVATRQQFEFVLMAVAEEVHAILKALPANQSNERREVDAREAMGTSAALKEEDTVESASREAGSAAQDVAGTSKTALDTAKDNGKAQTEKDTKSTPAKTTATTPAAASKKK